ncbi:MAG: helix-turn-helix domain-containing protein [Bacteroidales bacterium]
MTFEAIITTMPFSCALFWSVILYFKKNKDKSALILLNIMLIISVLLLTNIFFTYKDEQFIIITDSLYRLLHLILIPAAYLYLYSITSEKIIKKVYILNFFPGLIIGIIFLIIYVIMPNEECLWFIHNELYQNAILIPTDFKYVDTLIMLEGISKIIYPIQLILAMGFGLKHIRQFNNQIKAFYSDSENKLIRNVYKFTLIFIIAFIYLIVCDFKGREYYLEIPYNYIFNLLITFVVFYFGYVGSGKVFRGIDMKNEFKINDENKEDEKILEYQPPTVQELLVDESNVLTAQMIIKIIEKGELYKNPSLKVSDMAFALNTNRTYIYYAIKNSLHTNFSDLINDYRIKNSQKLMSEFDCVSDLYIPDIMESSGFSSESSFYRIFKKKTGQTPLHWFQKNLKSKSSLNKFI